MTRAPVPRGIGRAPAATLACGAALVLAALLGACGRKAVTAPAAHAAGPALVAVFPRERSFGVIVDAEVSIWAQFDRPLDPATVDSTNVYLKVDTRRQPVDISYDPFGHRIVLRPRTPLVVATTYTVEISPNLRAASGAALGRDLWWQFTTSSLYSIRNTTPAELSVEGPHAMLAWGGNAPAGSITYQVFGSTDSVAVAQRSIPALATVGDGHWFPTVSWAPGQIVYWAVTATDVSTGDRQDGPLGRFQVLPADAPTETDTLVVTEWGGGYRLNSRTQLCTATSLIVNSDYNSGMRFAISANHPDWRVVDARLECSCLTAAGELQLWYGATSWTACQMIYGGVPFAAGRVLTTSTFSGSTAALTGGALASFLDTAARNPNWYGFILKAPGSGSWTIVVNQPAYPRPRLVVTLQHAPAMPARPAR